MKEQIQAVSRMFWATVIAAVVVVAVGLPLGDDADTMAALEELQAFQAGFPKEKLEQNLLTHAAVQGLVQPADVLKGVSGAGVPKVTLAKGAEPIKPRAALELGTLGTVEALGDPGATLEIASPKAAAITTALRWRLARAGADSYELTGLSLTTGSSSAAAVAREGAADEARQRLRETEADLVDKTKKHEAATELWEARRKWKAPWKAIKRANQKRLEARAAMQQAEKARDGARSKYEELAKQATGFAAGPAGDRDHGVVVATLKDASSGKGLSLQLPVALDRRSVAVPHLTGVSFPVAKDLGLWDAIKDGNAEQGIEYLNGRFSWHYAHVDVGGFKLGGMTLLQIAPLLVLIFMRQISRRARGLGASYNPFDQPQADALPRVGLGNAGLNLAALIGLPLLGCVLCAWSLIQIAHVPVGPVLAALGVVGIGGFAQAALGELLELRDAIQRSHSHPPPAPASK